MAPTPDMTPENYVKTAISSFNQSAADDNKFRSALSKWSGWSWLIILGVLLAVGLPMIALRTISQPRAYAPQEAETAVAAQSQVAALGRLEPKGGVTDVGIPLGSIVAEVLVSEGSRVEQDEIIAFLKGHREALANWDLIASQREEAKQQLQASVQFEQARINAATTRLNTTNEPQVSGVEAQAALVRRIEVEYAQAEAELDRFSRLYEQGAISKQDFDQRRGDALQLQEEINRAIATLRQLESTRIREMDQATADLQIAQADLQRAQGQNQLASLQSSLDVAEAQLEATIVRAPQNGEVLRILTGSGESTIDNGRGGGTLLKLGNTREMYVVAEVYESDASLVKPGQSVTVVSRNRAFRNALKGTVTTIGNEIFKNNILNDDPAALNDARVVQVKIRLEENEAIASLTNLQVDVRINVTGSTDDEMNQTKINQTKESVESRG